MISGCRWFAPLWPGSITTTLPASEPVPAGGGVDREVRGVLLDRAVVLLRAGFRVVLGATVTVVVTMTGAGLVDDALDSALGDGATTVMPGLLLATGADEVAEPLDGPAPDAWPADDATPADPDAPAARAVEVGAAPVEHPAASRAVASAMAARAFRVRGSMATSVPAAATGRAHATRAPSPTFVGVAHYAGSGGLPGGRSAGRRGWTRCIQTAPDRPVSTSAD